MLFILEDQPHARQASQRNYLKLQAFLAQVDPGHRGPLVSRDFALGLSGFQDLGDWVTGASPNSWPLNSDRVLEMLQLGTGMPNPQVQELVEAIRLDGLAYTDYWWASWEKN
jgi:hypothetical protein